MQKTLKVITVLRRPSFNLSKITVNERYRGKTIFISKLKKLFTEDQIGNAFNEELSKILKKLK